MEEVEKKVLRDEAAFPHLTTRGSSYSWRSSLIAFALGRCSLKQVGGLTRHFLPLFFLSYVLVDVRVDEEGRGKDEEDEKRCALKTTTTLTDRILMLIRLTGPTNTCTRSITFRLHSHFSFFSF